MTVILLIVILILLLIALTRLIIMITIVITITTVVRITTKNTSAGLAAGPAAAGGVGFAAGGEEARRVLPAGRRAPRRIVDCMIVWYRISYHSSIVYYGIVWYIMCKLYYSM